MTGLNKNRLHAIILIVMALLEFMAVLPGDTFTDLSLQKLSNMLSTGTALTNLLAANIYVITAIALVQKKEPGKWFSYVRGAGAFYMLCVLLAFSLLMQTGPYIQLQSGFFEWKNFVLHMAGPLFMIIWWMLWPPRYAISSGGSFLWLIPPAAYMIYTLIYGTLTSWYPYTFLDPAKTGSSYQANVNLFFAAIGFVALAQLIAWMSRIRNSDHRS